MSMIGELLDEIRERNLDGNCLKRLEKSKTDIKLSFSQLNPQSH